MKDDKQVKVTKNRNRHRDLVTYGFAVVFVTRLICVSDVALSQGISRVYPSPYQAPLSGVVCTDDGKLYAAGFENTLLRSLDEGQTWEQLSTGEHRLHFQKLVTDGDYLYLLASPYLYEGRPDILPNGYPFLVFRFDPQSEQLEHIVFPLYKRQDVHLYDIAATPNDLYLSYEGSLRRILHSSDRGGTWEDLLLPDSLGHKYSSNFFTIDGSDDILIHLYSGLERELLISQDHGRTWHRRICQIPAGGYFNGTAIQYLGNSRVLMLSRDLGNLLISDSTGEWKDMGYPPFGKIADLDRDPAGTIAVSTTLGGLFLSHDDGATWTMVHPEFNTQYTLEYDLSFFGSCGLIAVNSMGEIYLTHDSGVSWEMPRDNRFTISYSIWAQEQDGLVRFLDWKTWNGSYQKTTDGFKTFQPVTVYPKFVPRPVSKTLWYCTSFLNAESDTLIYRSLDGGMSWVAAYVDEEVETLQCTSSSPYPANYVLAMNKGLLYTSDSGQNWSWILTSDWDRENGAIDVQISPYDGAVWMIEMRDSKIHSVVRSSPDFQRWDTVLELSQRDKDRVYHISQLRVLPDGTVYAVAKLMEDGSQRSNTLVFYSADNGNSWQSYETQQASQGAERLNEFILLSSGAMLSAYRSYPFHNNWCALTLYSSTNGLRSDTLILETSLVGGVDLNSYNRFTYDLSGIGYFTTGYAIYRIMLPEVTSIHSPKQPPLPLSIGTPHPHPVSKDAGSATLFIQSDKLAEVNMTVHNLAGRGLRVLYTGELGADGRYVTWDIRGIAPGTYLLQLGSKKGVCRRKVVVE